MSSYALLTGDMYLIKGPVFFFSSNQQFELKALD